MAVVENIAGRRRSRGVGFVSAATPATVTRWLAVALVLAAAMLVGVLVVAVLSGEARRVPASKPPFVTGNLHDAAGILGRNLLVLLLYATCGLTGWGIQRWRSATARAGRANTDRAPRFAMAMVVVLLLLVAYRQGAVLGHGLSGFANYFYVPTWRLWLSVLPHALPELTAILLPVAAWLYASRKGEQRNLPALIAAAVLAALPLLVAAALIEVYVSPTAFRAVLCIGEEEGFPAGGDCPAEAQSCPKLSAAQFERRFHIRLSQAEISDGRRPCDAPPQRH